jgi:regulator of sigma E protease
MMVDFAPRADGVMTPVQHLLGLTPVVSVQKPEVLPTKTGKKDDAPEDAGKKAGLEPDDIFARIGDAEFPNAAQCMAEIKARRSSTVPMVLLRRSADGALHEVKLPTVPVSRKGVVGFAISLKNQEGVLVSLPSVLRHPGAKENFTPAAARVIVSPGTKILTVGGTKVSDFPQLRAALLAATRDAFERRQGGTVQLSVQRPINGSVWDKSPAENFDWALSQEEVVSLHALAWESPEIAVPFEPETVIRIAKNPVEAVQMGLAETRRVMLTTYITFARLAEGTVKVEHLKGPVGIAHLGTLVAERGMIWLLFFLGLISINLAVINFLPLPIVDGGQFLFLVYEQIRGKPVPVGFQNAVTMAGLVLIGCVFLIVTYNDITSLLGL